MCQKWCKSNILFIKHIPGAISHCGPNFTSLTKFLKLVKNFTTLMIKRILGAHLATNVPGFHPHLPGHDLQVMTMKMTIAIAMTIAMAMTIA